MDNNAKISCKYFPQLPARWHCPRCMIDISDACAKRPEHTDDRYEIRRDCPICLEPLQSLGIGNSIKPFWERIPTFFVYPAKSDALVYITVLSLLNVLFTVNTLLGIGAFLMTSYALLLYAYKCLNHVARGHLEAPGLMVDYRVLNSSLIFKQIMVYFLVGLALRYAERQFGMPGLIVTGAFFLLGLPASTTLLAINGSIIDAVNPVSIFRTMATIGRPYFILYLFLQLMLGSHEMLQYTALKYIPDFLIMPAGFFLQAYFTLAMYAMMGYVIYQYHEPLGFNEVRKVEESPHKPIPGLSADPLLNEIYILNIEGKQDAAIKRLQKAVNREPKPEYYARLHRLLQSAGRNAELCQNGETYLKFLLKQEAMPRSKRFYEAAGVYADCLRADPAFQYQDPQVVFKLAEAAFQNRQFDDCLAILNGYHKRFPQSELLPNAYLVVAKVMVEHKQDDAQAKKILDALLKRYPDHAVTPQIKEYHQLVSAIIERETA
ncbi:tetratricopeptide repeat protein [Methylobacter sp. YRD-M1]|uniref:tetratricopeptide repeat protein n=1 Tax=Methylobacter sp. YRD-M1 TaxID=2911520 RepID=UPI00227BC616|nr:tetratricopeptide repeat protein [Methylobacter sp. YRD-M1]WAK03610.1 tetratricopeptide repeat protein [Methylobacter sp. YRD-M1]